MKGEDEDCPQGLRCAYAWLHDGKEENAAGRTVESSA